MILFGLRAALVKDFRLLARDRVGLVFLTAAPIIVTTVAGLSLASLYGADPRGTSAYVLPIADEDAGPIGRMLRERLTRESSVEARFVADAAAARAQVATQQAGAALVIPRGTSAALAEGRDPTLWLYTDPVKYLEVAHIRGIVQELRHQVARAARDRARGRLEKARRHAERTRQRFERTTEALAATLEETRGRIAAARASVETDLVATRARAEARARRAFTEAADVRVSALRGRITTALTPLRTFVGELAVRQRAFTDWLVAARERAGSFADRLPPPPDPPVVPAAIRELAEADTATLVERLIGTPPAALDVEFPPFTLPSLPALPALDLPSLPALPAVTLPGAVDIAEQSVTGAPQRLNTFDQNVPGFSVTFLLLGMLLGVSLALIDERDWGTFDRVRTTPTPLAAVLVAKLFARFTVGVAQMVVLLAIGRLAFGMSLGPQPWALLLPTAGIVFAGTAFGLVVAGAARSREAVLPIGSIVIVTMAAVGGCWWPIDLEPRWMRSAARIFPTTWAMAAFNDLMIRRQGAGAVVRATVVLLAHGVTYLVAGLLLLRRRGGTAS